MAMHEEEIKGKGFRSKTGMSVLYLPQRDNRPGQNAMIQSEKVDGMDGAFDFGVFLQARYTCRASSKEKNA
jgi:hypothetical protein